jgi:serine/threonine protein phosphatase PrpC
MLHMVGATLRGTAHINEGKPNQDAFQVGEDFAAVADGVGSTRNAELASRSAVECFARGIRRIDVNLVRRQMLNLLRSINDEVYVRAMPGLTTLVGVWFPPWEDPARPFWGLSLGDSRAYSIDPARAGPDRLRVLTMDDAQTHKDHRMRILETSVGHRQFNQGTCPMFEGELSVGEAILLCSDGLWGALEGMPSLQDMLVASIDTRHLRQPSLKAVLQIAGKASRDDATAAVVYNDA